MRATINGVELHYDLEGSGPTIALTHGIGSSGRDWAPIVPALAEKYQVLTWDVRGFGRSEKNPNAEYSLRQFAADLAGLLDHIGVAKAYIGGTSMGGTITQRFILDYPEKTAAAIIMSTSSQVNERARDGWFAQADAIERDGMAAWVQRGRPPMSRRSFSPPTQMYARQRNAAFARMTRTSTPRSPARWRTITSRKSSSPCACQRWSWSALRTSRPRRVAR